MTTHISPCTLEQMISNVPSVRRSSNQAMPSGTGTSILATTNTTAPSVARASCPRPLYADTWSITPVYRNSSAKYALESSTTSTV